MAAMIVVARDEFGDPSDLVAFRRRGDLLAAWTGAVAMLGAQNVLAPRIDGVLQVHETALAWLIGNREGVVLVDERRASIELQGLGPFRAADVEHGLHLRDLFTPKPPSIVVPQPVEVRHAA